MKIFHLVLLMGLFVLFAGCSGEGGSASKAGTAKDFDACSLLGNGEVEAELGGAIQRTEHGSSPSGTQFCHWYGPRYSSTLDKGITIMVALDNGADRYRAFKGLVKTTTDVAGIGDAAYSTPEGALTLYRGNVFLQVSPLYNETGHTIDMSKRLAAKALESL